MAHKFAELEAKMPAASRRLAKAKARRMLAEMLLPELRRRTGMTQAELARTLGIRQPTLSRMESQSDMQVGTLKRIVEALGGELDIVVHLPVGDYRLVQPARAPCVADNGADYRAAPLSRPQGTKGPSEPCR